MDGRGFGGIEGFGWPGCDAAAGVPAWTQPGSEHRFRDPGSEGTRSISVTTRLRSVRVPRGTLPLHGRPPPGAPGSCRPTSLRPSRPAPRAPSMWAAVEASHPRPRSLTPREVREVPPQGARPPTSSPGRAPTPPLAPRRAHGRGGLGAESPAEAPRRGVPPGPSGMQSSHLLPGVPLLARGAPSCCPVARGRHASTNSPGEGPGVDRPPGGRADLRPTRGAAAHGGRGRPATRAPDW